MPAKKDRSFHQMELSRRLGVAKGRMLLTPAEQQAFVQAAAGKTKLEELPAKWQKKVRAAEAQGPLKGKLGGK